MSTSNLVASRILSTGFSRSNRRRKNEDPLGGYPNSYSLTQVNCHRENIKNEKSSTPTAQLALILVNPHRFNLHSFVRPSYNLTYVNTIGVRIIMYTEVEFIYTRAINAPYSKAMPMTLRNERSEVSEIRCNLSCESGPLIFQLHIFTAPINILFLSRSVPEATQKREDQATV